MKMKVAVVASSLLVSVQTALAQYYYVNPYSGPNSFYYQYYWDSPAAEDDLADAKARREKAREERAKTGKSDVGARLRLQEECTRALERGVEDNVRRSLGCGD